MSYNCLAGFSVAFARLQRCEFLDRSDVSDSNRWYVSFAIVIFIIGIVDEGQDNTRTNIQCTIKMKNLCTLKCRCLPFAQSKGGTNTTQKINNFAASIFAVKRFIIIIIEHRPFDGLFVVKKLLLIFNSIINFIWRDPVAPQLLSDI